MAEESIAVRIGGQEYRIRSSDDAESLQRVASHVDDAMDKIRARTGTVDTLDVALLTALNLARELLELKREESDNPATGSALRALVDLAESALPAA